MKGMGYVPTGTYEELLPTATDVEQELLFARNTRLRILHVDPNGDFIDAEMVDD